MSRTDTRIPVDIAIAIRKSCWPRPTWKEVGIQLHKLGYPPAPFPPFQALSIMTAVSKIIRNIT
jgi:hypothetical protein